MKTTRLSIMYAAILLLCLVAQPVMAAGYLLANGIALGSDFHIYNSYTGRTSRGTWASSGAFALTPTCTTTDVWSLDCSTLTTGNGLEIICVDTALNAGKYINLYGRTGTTSIWSVAENGVTQVGESTGIDLAAGASMIYGYYVGKTTAVTGTGIGVKGNARALVASSAGTFYGGQFLSGNGSNATTADGVSILKVAGIKTGFATTARRRSPTRMAWTTSWTWTRPIPSSQTERAIMLTWLPARPAPRTARSTVMRRSTKPTAEQASSSTPYLAQPI
jgi:hypothetical protein